MKEGWSKEELVEWQEEQRRLYHEGKLEQGKIAKLESIGFDWNFDPYEKEIEIMDGYFYHFYEKANNEIHDVYLKMCDEEIAIPTHFREPEEWLSYMGGYLEAVDRLAGSLNSMIKDVQEKKEEAAS